MDDFEQEYEWLDRSDDYNVWEENQLALDREAEADYEEPPYYEYCDECGDGLFEGEGNGFFASPINLVWKNAGESGVVCDKCQTALGWEIDHFGDVHVVLCDVHTDAGTVRKETRER